MIQSACYLVCLGKKKNIEKKREKRKEKKRERKRKKKCEKKGREKKQISDLSRLNLVVEFGLESVLRTVQ